MATDTLRSVSLRRTATGQYVATNARGDELAFGNGDGLFSPIELLLAAISGCTASDVDMITSRRAEPESFVVDASADKIGDASGNRLENIEVVFRITFPDGEGGDKARAVLPAAMQRSHDRLCTVSRTVELGTPVLTRAEQPSDRVPSVTKTVTDGT
jgi:putative redox protein